MTKRRIKKKKKWAFLKFSLFLYLVVGIFTLIWFRTEVVTLEYELGELNKQKTGLIREQKFVTAKRASFYSAKNIEETAVKVLGMSHSERKNIFHIERTAGVDIYKINMK
jgi:hypothetical protein